MRVLFANPVFPYRRLDTAWRTCVGHFWTLAPFLLGRVASPSLPESRHWTTVVDDSAVGAVVLSGRLTQQADPATESLVVIVHGLGGSAESDSTRTAARAAARAGMDSLRLNLRGADWSGADYYHGGQTDDLHAALRSAALVRYRHLFLLGHSSGGNTILRYLACQPDERVRRAAVVCSPIDLEASAYVIDQPQRAFYRRYVLRGLKEIYARVAAKRPVPVLVSDAMRIDTQEEWDTRIVSPRYGFLDARDYWARTSACTVLAQVSTPTLFVAAEHDPMVSIDTIRPWLNRSNAIRSVIVEQGGHLGFSPGVDLGIGKTGSVEDQLMEWLLEGK